MMLALQCVPHDTEVHLFGYNWTSEKQFKAHRLAFEEQYAALMVAAGRVIVHPPPCGRLRQCDPPSGPPAAAGGVPVLWGPMGGDSLATDDDGVKAQNGNQDGGDDDDVEAQ